ncbi:DUF397 domain-containing protein [Streptomyces sp. VRA16 Mangrove soil]|uniref:DUF397 domain-containing protein n=1 Tax=Streptomyces sp. VRA16 Mangrove soil TaxID=2817434 RepID=UPI001A9CD0D3|nr:DUF397 domain-containing protein [Streptomyces sp. VRA16 Mangrove soil]MBO1335869.1 DUF397 domain-containing protein [Streptomyces sp. VRA16 Mangrove soil]
MPPTTATTATPLEIRSAAWHKSSFSGASNGCIEHAELSASRRAIRDTEYRENGALVFESPAWLAFVSGVNSGVLPL